MFASLAFDDSNFRTGLNNSANTFTGFIGKVGGGLAKLGLAIGATMAGIVGTSATFAAGFEKNMANVGTLLDGDVTPRVKELGDEVLNMAKKTGLGTETLTGGLYQTISALGDSAESMGILETAAKGAKAGNLEVTDSVNFLSAVMKGYGDISDESAKKASDLGFLTAKLGQTSMPELAASMGKVIPLAATMKVGQEELFGAMATLTGVTGGTAEVTTQLRGAIQGFMQPSKEMAGALTKIGYSNGQAALESLGLQGALDALKASVNNDEIAFSNLFGSVEAKSAVLALTGAQAEDFTKKTEAMRNATGATDEAFEKQMATFDSIVQKLKALGETAQIQLGTLFLPAITDVATAIGDFLTGAISFDEFINTLNTSFNELLTKFGEAMPGTQGVIDAFLNFKSQVESIANEVIPQLITVFNTLKDNLDSILLVITPLVTAFIAWKTAFTIATAIQAFTTALGGASIATKLMQVAQTALNTTMLANPFVLVATLIGALVGAFLVLYNTNENFRKKVDEVFSKVKATIEPVMSMISKKFTEFVQYVTPIINEWMPKFQNAISVAFDTAKTIIEIFVSAIGTHIQNVIAVFTGIITFIQSVFKGDWEGAWNAVKDTFTNVFENIKSFLDSLPGDFLKIGKDVIDGFIQGVGKKAEEAINSVKKLGSDIIDGAKHIFKTHSPSKVFEDEVGAMVPAGLAIGITKKEKLAIKAAEQMATKTYSSAKTWIENYRNDTDYLASEELKMWEKLAKTYTAVSKEKVEIDKNIAKLREVVASEEFEASKKWIEKRKFFDLMSIEEEIDALTRMSTRYAEGSTQREEIDRSLYTAKKALIAETEQAEKDALDEQKKALEEEKRIAKEQEDLYKNQADLVNKITDAENKYKDAVNARADAIFNAYGLFDEVKKEEALTAQQMTDNLKGQVTALRDWTSDLEKLRGRGLDAGFISQLEQLGPNEMAQIDTLSKMSETGLNNYVKLWQEKQELARVESVKEHEKMRTEINQEIDLLLQDLAKTVDSDSMAIGKSIADGILKGFKDNAPKLPIGVDATKTGTKTAETKTNTMTDLQVASSTTSINIDSLKGTMDSGFTSITESVVAKLGTMLIESNKIIDKLMITVENTLRVKGFDIGRVFMKSLGDALIAEKAYLLAEALEVADAIVDIFRQRENEKLRYGNDPGYVPSWEQGDTATAPGQNNVEQNLYFYGVREEQTAFEAAQAARRGTWEALT